MIRVGVWAAVSSRPQADESKESLPSQQAQGREFAAEKGGEVVRVYEVPGHTRDLIFYADAAEQMPAYAELRRDVEAGRLDVLWYSLLRGKPVRVQRYDLKSSTLLMDLRRSAASIGSGTDAVDYCFVLLSSEKHLTSFCSRLFQLTNPDHSRTRRCWGRLPVPPSASINMGAPACPGRNKPQP